MIILTGYLIIYNIFQISVIKDIRTYGLLKTIGTTPRQIKKIIRNQAFLLSFIGIPIGLVLGFIIGNLLLPSIMNVTNFKKAYVSFNPIIFIGSALFSLITVYISCKKPGKIASSVSPVEATRYNEVSMKSGKKNKKSIDGTKVYKMALYNIQRNRKKTIIVIASMSLSLILLNSVYTFTNSFDMDKYVSKNVVSDFLVSNASYFNVAKEFKNNDDVVSESLIKNIKALDYYKDGGRMYYSLGEESINYKNEERHIQLYGADDFAISQIEILKGNIDKEKLKSGNYIFEAIEPDDNGRFHVERSKYDVGEKVDLNFSDGNVKQYEVIAKVGIKYAMTVRYSWIENDEYYPQIILPSSEFCRVIKEPLTMTYMYNVDKDKVKEAEQFIKSYTDNIESNMSYESKQVYIDAFYKFKSMFLLVGGALSIVIGIIGILNFINAILTSIISRQREFAMLQSIGMTTKQLKNMLSFEGGFYAVTTILLSCVLGSIVSLGVISAITRELWFCKYHFAILPLMISAPILLIFGVVIPLIAYKTVNKKSVVERLRESE